jgi:hypothetical protein
MARHGYVLQKSKEKIEFEDIDKTMQDFEIENEEKRYSMLKELMKKKNESSK